MKILRVERGPEGWAAFPGADMILPTLQLFLEGGNACRIIWAGTQNRVVVKFEWDRLYSEAEEKAVLEYLAQLGLEPDHLGAPGDDPASARQDIYDYLRRGKIPAR